jgi:nitroreductase
VTKDPVEWSLKEVLTVDVLEAIKGRRSIRKFTDKPIGKETLEVLLDAARWAPTASNQQRWRFVVVTSPSMKQLVIKFAPGIFAMPSAFIVICVEKKPGTNPVFEATYLADCSMAAQNIMLAAHEMGIGTCVALSYAKVAIREILDLPEGIEPMLVLTLGYPAEDPAPPARLPIRETAFAEKYGKEWES